MRLHDSLLGSLLLVLSGALAFLSRGFPAVPGQDYGASAFPTLIAVGFAFCGLVLVASGVRQNVPLVTWQAWTRTRSGVVNVLATIGAVVFYMLAENTLGFILTMAIVLLALLRLFRVGWLPSVLTAVVVPIVMQYVFGRLLSVPLPWGLLSPVRWM